MNTGKTEEPVALGSELRQLRRGLNLTQFELARLAGVCQGIISRVERDTHVSPESMRRVVEALVAARARPRGRGR